jgi:hypothetical protein
MLRHLIAYSLIAIFIFVFCQGGYCNSKDPETVLMKFLKERSQGKYQNCSDYYSVAYKKRHIQQMGTDCYEWYRTNETEFKNPKIIRKKKTNGKITLTVTVSTEDPTSTPIFGSAIEHYDMVMENGEWKIDNWSIKYK